MHRNCLHHMFATTETAENQIISKRTSKMIRDYHLRTSTDVFFPNKKHRLTFEEAVDSPHKMNTQPLILVLLKCLTHHLGFLMHGPFCFSIETRRFTSSTWFIHKPNLPFLVSVHYSELWKSTGIPLIIGCMSLQLTKSVKNNLQ